MPAARLGRSMERRGSRWLAGETAAGRHISLTGDQPASSERHFDRRLTIMSEPNGTMGEASTWKKKASGGAETVESAQDATKTGVDGVGSSASSGPKAQAAAGGGGCCVIM